MIDDFITHMEAQVVVPDGYLSFRHSWDLQPYAQDFQNAELPLAAVYSAKDVSSPARDMPTLRQQNTVQIFVFTMSNYADLHALRELLFGAALGWQFEPTWMPLEHADGSMQHISGQRIAWLDVFQTERTLKQP